MASDNKNGEPESLVEKNRKAVIPDELDLDKNPIKYATHEPGVMTTEAHDKDYMELTLRSGKHSPLAHKILRQRIELRAKEFPRWPADLRAGVRAVWAESRFWYDRERLGPDFDHDWRSYRARYLKSLELDPREPVLVPEYEKLMLNPIRRFYMKGGDLLEYKILRRFSDDKWRTAAWRVGITRFFMSWLFCMGCYYYTQYHPKDWDLSQGWKLFRSRPIIHPGHPKYPYQDYRIEPSDHDYARNFPLRTIYKDLRDYDDISVVL